MADSKFVYVIYIRATPQKLWNALTEPELQQQYWFGLRQESGWTEGSAWAMKYSDGRTANSGRILEAEPAKRLVFAWINESRPEMASEGVSRCAYEIGADGDTCKLTVRHEIALSDSKLIAWVSQSWPMALSSLKSFLETGAALPRPAN
jgi:uncharacterized protein YndB with AHSA1/START domain